MNRESTQDQILRDVLRLLRRQRGLIIAFLVIAATAAGAYAILKTPVYEASADLQFNDPNQDLVLLGSPNPAPTDPAKQAAADAVTITSSRVVQRVSHTLKLPHQQVRSSVSVSVDPNNNLVTVRTEASSPRRAARLANAFARQTKTVVTRSTRARLRTAATHLEQATQRELRSGGGKTQIERNIRNQTRASTADRLSRLQSLASFVTPVTIASSASVPSAPTSPQPVRDVALALFLGLIFGLLAAFMRDSLDRRLTDAHDVQHQMQFPMVGYVEADSLGVAPLSQNGAARKGESTMEAFRILRSNVEFLAPKRPLETIAVTSPVAEEGKSTVAAGLATASALAGKRVLLLECDLRRPVLAERLRLRTQPGLTDWLSGAAEPSEVVQVAHGRRDPIQHSNTTGSLNGASANPGVATIVAGSSSPRPTELLGSDRFRELLEDVGRVYDLVVLDCAPLLPVGDSLEILPLVDALLVCIRLDQTTREQAVAAKGVVDHLPARPTGIVITGVRPGREGYYYGYYSSSAARSEMVGSADIPS